MIKIVGAALRALWTIITAKHCTAVLGGFECNRADGHHGEHAARLEDGSVVHWTKHGTMSVIRIEEPPQ